LDDSTMFELFDSLKREMHQGFESVNQRLDRIDATLTLHGKQLGTGARAIASLVEWTGKADSDYQRVLAEMADLKLRVAKLEGKS
jgi:hypothetical protein